MTEAPEEIAVWTDEGYEGRFVKWETNSWRAYEYRNYRHWFSPPQQPTEIDIRAIRGAYKISIDDLSDVDLARTSPVALSQMSREGRRFSG